MKYDRQVAFRLPPDLVRRLDLEAERMTKELGFKVSRSDVVRKILNEELNRHEAELATDPEGHP